MTIVCSLRWGVAYVGSFSIERVSFYKGKHFKCGTDTGGWCSFEAVFVKKPDM